MKRRFLSLFRDFLKKAFGYPSTGSPSQSKPDGFASSPKGRALGKEVRLYEMPRAPLLGGLSPQVTGGLSREPLLALNPIVIPTGCHRP